MPTDERPFPPGEYPIVIVGSGPGALQVSYFLSRLGIEHAVISNDSGPGGMFRRWPFFQRLLSWTKPYALVDRRSREFERWDWNSLLAREPELRGMAAEFMDGTSDFPSRPEMEANLAAFAERAGCWGATNAAGMDAARETADGNLILTTSMASTAAATVFAVGVASVQPSTPGIELSCTTPTRETGSYAAAPVHHRQTELGFELATGCSRGEPDLAVFSITAKTSSETRSSSRPRALRQPLRSAPRRRRRHPPASSGNSPILIGLTAGLARARDNRFR